MPGLKRQDEVRPRRRGRPARLATGATAVALVLAASLAGMALAASTATVGSASNAKLGEQIVIDAHGRTLYALSPETTSHLLCKSSECLKFWPPLTVSSHKVKLVAGHGVHGHLGLLRRSNGTLQVTLRGLPLYRYSGDRAKGQANGQGLKSFGGTWHAVTAAAGASAPSSSEGTSSPGTEPKKEEPKPEEPKYGYTY